MTTHRPGSTRALRKLRAFVLDRDGYRCKRPDCPIGVGHQLTTHDRALPTHATLGHIEGREWIITRHTSLDPADYRAECARSNYGDGARITNARRAGRAGLNTSRSW